MSGLAQRLGIERIGDPLEPVRRSKSGSKLAVAGSFVRGMQGDECVVEVQPPHCMVHLVVQRSLSVRASPL